MKEKECEFISNGVRCYLRYLKDVFELRGSVYVGFHMGNVEDERTKQDTTHELRVWLVGLLGMIDMYGMEPRRVMNLVRCGYVDEVEFESEGWFSE